MPSWPEQVLCSSVVLLVTVGNIVGHECILAMSTMNNAIVLFPSKNDKLHNDIESVLKVNGRLCAPLKLLRGMTQGCSL